MSDYIGLRFRVPADMVSVNGDYVGDGYGLPTQAMLEAIWLVARFEEICWIWSIPEREWLD
jgi:L-cysteate sulfo-lyase